jgi:hypothetical protein
MSRKIPTHDHGQRFRGDTLRFPSVRKTSAGVVVDLTGYTVRATVRSSAGDAVDGVVVTVTPLTGRVEVVIPAAVSATLAPDKYSYDIEYQIGTEVETLVRYTFSLVEDVTR